MPRKFNPAACAVESCADAVGIHGRSGMCNRHRLAASIHGDPLASDRHRASLQDAKRIRQEAAARAWVWKSCACGARFTTNHAGRTRCDDCQALARKRTAPPFDCTVCGCRVVPGAGGHHYQARLYCSAACRTRAQNSRNRDARRAAKDRRRARLRGAYVAPVRRRDIFERDGWTCRLCGDPLEDTAAVPHPLAPTLDHIVPLAAGGTHEPDNCQAAHFLCNSRKGARVEVAP